MLDQKRSARIVWKHESGKQRVAYLTERGDPLRLTRARSEMLAVGLIDEDGFADDRDWLTYSGTAYYPDVMHRLIEVFLGSHVASQATVFFTLKPGTGLGLEVGPFRILADRRASRGDPRSHGRGLEPGLLPQRATRALPRTAVRAGDVFLPFVDAWRRAHCAGDGREYAGAEAHGEPLDAMNRLNSPG